MALQAVHGLVRGAWREGLTAQPVWGKGGQGEIDSLLARIADTRTLLQGAREIRTIGDLLALTYRCEDRIRDIKRKLHRR